MARGAYTIMMEIQLVAPSTLVWSDYFDPRAAVNAVYAHIASLPSSRTEEGHTSTVYTAGLKYFMQWAGDALPTPDLMRVYVAHLVMRGLKSSTIYSRYLASVRHYLRALSYQPITGLRGTTREFVADCRDQIRQAATMPVPRPEVVSNIPPLWRAEFNRLTLTEVNTVLQAIDRATINGLRDYALLHVAFSTGLRLAELARISLAAITPIGSDRYIVRVRGKRNNVDPVPLSGTAYRDVLAYTEAFNAGLSDEDPRRIETSTAVWQPRHRDRFYLAISRYTPAKGISHQAIRDVVAKRTYAALGKAIAVHDTRRTAAALAYDAGMPLPDIQLLLRHKLAAVTLAYIGLKPNFHDRAMDKYMTFG